MWLLAVSDWLVLLSPVGTLGLSVRCVKGYSVKVLTGTDAQTVRPYRVSLRIVSSRRASVVSVGCCPLTIGWCY